MRLPRRVVVFVGVLGACALVGALRTLVGSDDAALTITSVESLERVGCLGFSMVIGPVAAIGVLAATGAYRGQVSRVSVPQVLFALLMPLILYASVATLYARKAVYDVSAGIAIALMAILGLLCPLVGAIVTVAMSAHGIGVSGNPQRRRAGLALLVVVTCLALGLIAVGMWVAILV